MCLAVPGKILSITGDDPMLRTGKVSFGGIVKEVSLAYVPEAQVDDYVLVHVGFAISRTDEAEAAEVFEILKEMDELEGLDDEIPRWIPRRGRGGAERAGDRVDHCAPVDADGDLRRPDPSDRPLRH